MKIFVLLFFSSFLYAQEPNSNSQPNNNQGETPKNTVPETVPPEQPKKDSEPRKDASKETQTPDSSAKQTSVQNNKVKEAKSPTVQPVTNKPQTIAVPPQPLETSPKEPIPYYNPLHVPSSSAYQEGDLPSESVSDATAPKNRRHRFSVGGKLFDYHIQGDRKKINVNAVADYGYSRKYFEVGPYAKVEIYDFDIHSDQFQDALILDLGAFFEVNFTSHAKNTPSIGLKAGYKRKENINYLVGQPYVSMNFFLNHQTAFFVSLAPYFRYKLQGQKWEMGVEIPAGLRFYFY